MSNSLHSSSSSSVHYPLILICFSLLTYTSTSLSFRIDLPPLQQFCFYEVFQRDQKYSFFSHSPDPISYSMQVAHISDRGWQTVFNRTLETQRSRQTVRVDKLAQSSTTYSFCVVSKDSQKTANINITFTSGLSMLELNTLPDASDADNIQRELNWLEQQLNKLGEKSESIKNLRNINSQIHNMVGIKMIVFSVIGIIGISVVNFVFYRLLKGEFHRRKFI